MKYPMLDSGDLSNAMEHALLYCKFEAQGEGKKYNEEFDTSTDQSEKAYCKSA